MQYWKNQWERTPTKSRIILGILLAAVLVLAVLSWTGGINLFEVETGTVVPAEEIGSGSAGESLTDLDG